MSKRRNENGQMRREEYEAEEDRDPREDNTVVGFGMARASESEISKRRIVKPKAKRAAPAAAPSAPSSNPFSGFTGLTQPTAPAANPFSGFTGLTNPTAAPNVAAAPTASPTPAVTPAPIAAPAPKAVVSHTPLSIDWIKAKTSGQSREAAVGVCMEVLNKEFFAFVSQQVVENPMAFWTSAVQDYIRHAHDIEAKVLELHAPAKTVASTKSSTTKPAADFNFGLPSGGAKAAPFSFGGASSASTTTGFSFGAPSTTASPAKPSTSTGFSFGSKNSELAASSGFSFGAKPTDATTSSPAKPASTGFSFGTKTADSTSSPAKPASSGFSFGAKPTEAVTTSSPAKPASSGFSFGAKTADTTSSPAKPASSGFSFGAKPTDATTSSPAKPASSGFSFGAAPASKPTSSGFSFGATPAPTSSFSEPPAAFSFGGSAPAAASTGFAFNLPAKAPATAEAEDEDDENIGREEATVIIKSASEADEDVVFEADAVRIRQLKKEEKRWADIGAHPFKILQNKSTKAARILSRNSIGKIMINAALYKGLVVTVTPNKKAVTLGLVIDGVPTPMHFGIAADRVDELKKAIENACPK
ncbi:hypothetical protein ACHHYP_15962 [Achlya hypogyna]|uniref:RanBD1 domain-containing protein n=1 Tax=Achlya hypogyna TaxID=1202772 RepID=A0A1V9Y9U2_ACHHY|nr:hypothetical protein ACHHYP_15962 [Achlya hypogyna]